MTESIPSQLMLSTAIELADIARKTTMEWFRQPVEILNKADTSPVTIADRQTEEHMRSLIESRFPEHGIYGEEFGIKPGSAPWTWTLDPIDGTKSFVSGKPTFGSLVALGHNDQPVAGIIEMPALGERWIGIKDQPSEFNGARCRSANTSKIEDAVVLCSTPDMFDEEEWALFNAVSTRARSRGFGSDCLGYGLLASGFTDIVMESDLKPYDFLAVIPVVEGAGGVISDWQGNALTAVSGGQVLATANRQLHEKVLSVISENAS